MIVKGIIVYTVWTWKSSIAKDKDMFNPKKHKGNVEWYKCMNINVHGTAIAWVKYKPFYKGNALWTFAGPPWDESIQILCRLWPFSRSCAGVSLLWACASHTFLYDRKAIRYKAAWVRKNKIRFKNDNENVCGGGGGGGGNTAQTVPDWFDSDALCGRYEHHTLAASCPYVIGALELSSTSSSKIVRYKNTRKWTR